jgi:DNA mismatch repair protein MutS
MAQSGCFVPSKLRFKPYSKIITRLSGSDNIFSGQSSFAVEMSELRTILRQSDKNTLVIGDELCHTTESNSGIAITVSTLMTLINKNSTFIFATHMHEILNINSLKQIDKKHLRLCHLSISYDENTKMLTYDRKIKPGSGSTIYGILVAKYLDLPQEFIDHSYTVLSELTKENKNIIEPVTSRYNKNIYVDSCAICNRSKSQIQLHSHHLIEQKHSDNKGIIKGIIKDDTGDFVDVGILHKNCKDNIIVLCSECHINLHSNKQELETLYVPNGKIIRFKQSQPENIVI